MSSFMPSGVKKSGLNYLIDEDNPKRQESPVRRQLVAIRDLAKRVIRKSKKLSDDADPSALPCSEMQKQSLKLFTDGHNEESQDIIL